MNKIQYILAVALAGTVILSGCSETKTADTRVKVLLDTDMIQGFDDGVAMMMLLGAENVDLLGVTTETGNDWAREGVAYAIRQMEICGVSGIPVVQGGELPLRNGRYETMTAEIERSTGIPADWYGACGFEKPESWKASYISNYGQEPALSPVDTSAVDFIINTIKANPGEVAVVAIGPTSNVARALLKAPEIASLAKEIIYMGGAFYCEGNTTADAELNVFYDPEAEQVCFKAPWPKQTIVSLDICNTVQLDKTEYEKMMSSIGNEGIRNILRGSRVEEFFNDTPDELFQIWDTISAALVIDPSLLLESNVEKVDVNVDPSNLGYGKTIVTDDETCREAVIPTKIDNERFWAGLETLLAGI